MRGGSITEKNLFHIELEHLAGHGFRILFVVCLILASLTSQYNLPLAIVEIIAILAGYYYLEKGINSSRDALIDTLDKRSVGMDIASRRFIISSPLPTVIFRPETEEIIWCNEKFMQLAGIHDSLYKNKIISELIPTFPTQWLLDGDNAAPEPVAVGESLCLVFGSLVNTDGKGKAYSATTFWVDTTEYAQAARKLEDSSPVLAVLQLDNYEDLIRGLNDEARSTMLNEISAKVIAWCDSVEGTLCRYNRDHFLMLIDNSRHSKLKTRKYSVMDDVRAIQSPNGVGATLSIGIGLNAENPAQLYQFASTALDMALGRGGDQIVTKDSTSFTFIGGRSRETERRTKVKSRVIANSISELLANAPLVLIMGHKSPDLDVLGAEAGICAIARYRNANICIVRAPSPYPAEEMAAQLASLPEYENLFITREEALALADKDTLLVVVDTNRPEQTQVPELLTACGRVVVIDHHRRAASYIENPIQSFHDPYASSACELTAELVQCILDVHDIRHAEAEAMLAGIVLDTKNFTVRTGSRTFEIAAFLRKAGADIAQVNRFFQSGLEDTVSKFDIIRSASLCHESIAIATADREISRVIAGQASDELLKIAGIEASFVLYRADGQPCLSARSGGDLNVQVICEMLGGGGNAATAGAQFPGREFLSVLADTTAAIDRYFEEA